MSNPRRTNGHRRNQVRARVLAEEETCWLCGGLVDKTIATPHPMSPEVDEVIPVSRGGSPYDRTNCRLSHRSCNRARSNGDPKPRVAPLTTERTWSEPGGA